VLLEALPPILVLHLKRFLFDTTADVVNKLTKPVLFTPELEIPSGINISFLIPPRLRVARGSVGLEIVAPVSGKSAEPVYYKLHGVLYHHGKSAASGHFTVNVLHPNGSGSEEAWLHIDDEAVGVVRHEDVFGGHDIEWVEDRCACMLFYCRTAPTQV
jgi:ubiquitin carboxyl-terminal hydrolase 10